ncbi:MAG: hypothetical protein DU429_03010 [Candidatus Tokpelaia sp.]|nr:MAG: hypothetical protein DU429_03010 [Candidatus Tokpelaia sp.]
MPLNYSVIARKAEGLHCFCRKISPTGIKPKIRPLSKPKWKIYYKFPCPHPLPPAADNRHRIKLVPDSDIS